MPKLRMTHEAEQTIEHCMEFVVAMFLGLGLPLMLCVIAARF